MLKKRFFIVAFLLALTLVVAAPMANAQPAMDAAAMEEAFKKEGPLTQADVDAYIKIVPNMAKSPGDENKIKQAINDAGFTDSRGIYVTTKMAFGVMAETQAEVSEQMKAQVPDYIWPTEAELVLIRKNLEKIKSAAGM